MNLASNKLTARLTAALRWRNGLGGQLVLLLALNIFAGLLLCGPFLVGESIRHDNLYNYSIFRDQWNALNYHGEILWWNPGVQLGFPFYYTSILAFNAATPIHALASLPPWIAGRFGFHFHSFYTYYVAYFAFWIPLLLSLGMLALARQIFRNWRVIAFILILTAFSPATVYSFIDLSPVEEIIYGLFFAAAFLHFLKRRHWKSFLLLAMATLALAAAASSHEWLYWNALFVPSFVVIAMSFGRRGFRDQLAAFKAVPWWSWAVLAGSCLICLIPAAVTFSQGTDILRGTIGTRVYDLKSIRPGNPLEFAGASTPAIGWAWAPGQLPHWLWQPYNYEDPTEGLWLSYNYCGALAIPLALLGLIAGRRAWRIRFLIFLILFGLIVPLAAHSSFFSPVLSSIWLLRAVAHFSDLNFRVGGCLLIILAAGLGFDAFLRRRARRAKSLLTLLAVCSVAAIAFFIGVYKSVTLTSPMFGFYIVAVVMMGLTIHWLARTRRPSRLRAAFVCLMALALLDVSTLALWYMHDRVMPTPMAALPDPPPQQVGSPPDVRSYAAQTFTQLRQVLEFTKSGHNSVSLPPVALLDSDQSLLTDPDAQVVEAARTYNTLDFKVVAPKPSLLVWRSFYFPYWKAHITTARDSTELDVQKDPIYGLFAAVPVPAGASTVHLTFSPKTVPTALFLAYFVIILAATFVTLAHVAPHYFPGPGQRRPARPVRIMTGYKNLAKDRAVHRDHE